MRARRSGRSCSRSNLPWLGSSVSERMEAPAQLVGEQIGHFERSKVSASIKLVPVEQLRIDLRRPASRRRQVVRKHADADRQFDPAGIIALVEGGVLLKVEAR